MNVSHWNVIDAKKVPLMLVLLEGGTVGHTVGY
jgi:hypothetical protein